MSDATPFVHRIRVRYQECDMQKVVFNAHYLAYCDDAFGVWVEAAMPGAMSFVGNAGSFDVVVKKAVVTWSGALRFGETVDIDCAVDRWGRSSFDVAFRGSVGGAERFDVLTTYVNVSPGTHTPAPVAAAVKSAFGAAKVHRVPPITASEDFSEFVNAGVPSMFFFVGVYDPKDVEASRKPGGKPLPFNHSPFFAPVPEPSIKTSVKAMSLAVLLNATLGKR